MKVYIKRIYHKGLISIVNVHQKSLSYILPLACSRRPDGTQAKQEKGSSNKSKEAVRGHIRLEKKTLTKNRKVLSNRKMRLNASKSQP